MTSNALQILQTIADQADIDTRIGGWNRADEQVARFTHDGVCLRVKVAGQTGSEIVKVEQLEYRMDDGVYHWARFSPSVDIREAHYIARPFALLGWAVDALTDMVNAKARAELRSRIA